MQVVDRLPVLLEPGLVRRAVAAGGAVDESEVAEDRPVAVVKGEVDGDGGVPAAVPGDHGPGQEGVPHGPETAVEVRTRRVCVGFGTLARMRSTCALPPALRSRTQKLAQAFWS